MNELIIICLIVSIGVLASPQILNIILVLRRRVTYKIIYKHEYREFHIYKNNEKIGSTSDIESAREFAIKDSEKDPYDKYKSVTIKINYTENL